MKYISDKSVELIKNVVKNVLEMEIDNQDFSGLDIIETRDILSNLVVDVVNEKLAESHIQVRFDSPMGSDSRYIRAAGKDLIVDSYWTGHPGTRGYCYVLVRRIDFNGLSCLEAYLKTLKDDRGNEYVDEQTDVQIVLGEF